MTTLTDFLLARIAEDEAAAREAQEWTYQQEAEWWAEGEWWLEGVCMSTIGSGHTGSHIVGYSYSDQTAEHIARHDPARVLAECEAKRRIAEEHVNEGALDGLSYCGTCEDRRKHDAANWPCVTIRALAAVYADHPDYREEWRL